MMRDRVGLTLEQIARAGPVQIGLRDRCRQAEEHELCGFIDTSPQLDGNLAEVRHLESDPRVEARIDLRSRYMDRHADASPTASSFDEPCEIRRDVNGFECLSEDEPARLESEGVGLTMLPEIRRIPQRWIDMNAGQVVRRLLCQAWTAASGWILLRVPSNNLEATGSPATRALNRPPSTFTMTARTNVEPSITGSRSASS